MPENDARKTGFNHVKVAAADTTRGHCDEFSGTIGGVFFNNRDNALGGDDSKHGPNGSR